MLIVNPGSVKYQQKGNKAANPEVLPSSSELDVSFDCGENNMFRTGEVV